MAKTLKGLYLAGTQDGLGTEESSFSWMMFCTMVWTGEPYRCPTALGQSPLQYRGLYLCGATIQLSHFSWLKLSLKSWSSHSFWGKRNCLKYSLRLNEAGTRGFFNSELTLSWSLRWRDNLTPSAASSPMGQADSPLFWSGPCEGFLLGWRECHLWKAWALVSFRYRSSEGATRRVMLNRLSRAEGCCSWSFTHVKFTDMWIFLLWEATRGSRGAVTSISIHLYFFLNSNCELKVNEYGALGRVLLENAGSFITRLHIHLTGKGKEMELLKVYSKTDLNKCSTTVTRSRLNSRSTDGRVPEKKNNPTVMPYITGSQIKASVPQNVLLSLFPPLSQALNVRVG